MPTQLQENFKAALARVNAIKAGADAKSAWTDDDRTQFDAAYKAATDIKAALEKETALNGLNAWAKEGDGQVVVKSGWAGEALPGEGDADGITEEFDSEHKSTGQLYETNGIGQKRLKAMKTGAYKDAWVQWFKSQCNPSRFPIKGDAMKVLNEGSDQAGTFWIPPDIRPELVKKTATITGIASNCYTFSTNSDIVKFPKVVYTADDQWSTGLRPTWTAEPLAADASEATNPVAGQAEIPIYTAIIPILVTRAQVEDNGFDLLGYLSELIGETAGLFKDQAFVAGDGVGKPQGILNHPNVSVAAASGGMRIASGGASSYIWGTNMTVGLTAIEAALPPQYEANAKWFGCKNAYGTIRAIVDSQGRPLWNINDQYPTFTNGYAPTLLGYPIVKDQFFASVAASSQSLAFGDAMGYYAPQRVGLTIDVLREVKALRDQYLVYARFRLGGQLVQDWRMKVFQTAAS